MLNGSSLSLLMACVGCLPVYRLTACPAPQCWTPGSAKWSREPWIQSATCTNPTRGKVGTLAAYLTFSRALVYCFRCVFFVQGGAAAVRGTPPARHVKQHRWESWGHHVAARQVGRTHMSHKLDCVLPPNGQLFNSSLKTGSCSCTLHTTPRWSPVCWLWGFLTWSGRRTLPTSPWSCTSTVRPRRPSSKCRT